MEGKRTDPVYVDAIIRNFATIVCQRAKERAEKNLSGLKPGQGLKFRIKIHGDPNDWESFTTEMTAKGDLKNALKEAVTKTLESHPGYMTTGYFTVILITASDDEIVLPEAFWQDALHEVFHELDLHHVDNTKLTVHGMES